MTSDKYNDGKKTYESFIIYDNNLKTENTYQNILKQIEKIDKRNYFKNIALEIYSNNEKIGTMTTDDYKLLTILQEQDEWFLNYANKMYSKNGNVNSNEISFVRKEKNVLIKEREEIYKALLKYPYVGQDEELENATTNIYYFYDKVAKIEFYIIDYYVSGQQCYFNNYKEEIRNPYTKCQW